MQIGNYKCTSIDTSRFLLDGGAMFGVVPKTMWEKKIPADRQNRIPMSARCLLVQGNGRNILLDVGVGDKMNEKEKRIYGIDEHSTPIETALNNAGVDGSEITDVIISHLHFDHGGGATKKSSGKPVPTFPNATFYVQKKQWDNALNPEARDAASYMPENYVPLEEHGVLKLLDGPCEIFDGIDLIVTDGHTKSQQHTLIKGSGASLFYCADIFPTSAHIPPRWLMAYDNEPLVCIKEKKQLLERALKENWILFFEHDPVTEAAVLTKGARGAQIDKIVTI